VSAPSPRVLGAVALGCWGVHAVDLVLRGETHDLMWICNLAGPVLALGCFARRRLPVGIAVLWLVYGTPLWLLDMASGGVIIPTSFVSHFGCLAVGIVTVRAMGWERGAWWKTSVALVAVMALTRVITPPRFNVNLAFAVWDGWEDWFPSYGPYAVLLVTGSAVCFFVVGRLFERVAPAAPGQGAVGHAS